MQKHASKDDFRVTKLRVKNFRSIEDVELELGNLTALVGPNASGKSNLLDALRFISDAFRWDLERAISRRNGVGAISRRRSDARALDFELGVTVESVGYRVGYDFRVEGKPDGSFNVVEERGEVGAAGGSAAPVGFCIRNGDVVSPGWLSDAIPAFDSEDISISQIVKMLRLPGLYKVREDARAMARWLYKLQRLGGEMRFYHIPPDAIRDPQRVNDPSPLKEDGSNIASTLRDIRDNSPKKMDGLKEALGVMIQGITDLRIHLAGAYLITELAHSDSSDNGSAHWFDLSQESDGTLRLLAMLAAMNQRPSLPLIGIEEPELAVHLGAMEALAEDLMEAARRSQILLTTHSPHLIDQFPIENIRAVQMVDGVTQAGNVSQYQRDVVSQRLFSAGELHQSEGLRMFFD